jgi:hypothetical protein
LKRLLGRSVRRIAGNVEIHTKEAGGTAFLKIEHLPIADFMKTSELLGSLEFWKILGWLLKE